MPRVSENPGQSRKTKLVCPVASSKLFATVGMNVSDLLVWPMPISARLRDSFFTCTTFLRCPSRATNSMSHPCK